MAYDRQQLKTLVIEEAQKLLIHAMAEERGLLDFMNLSSKKIHRCIYGQMTGNCFSDRAVSLLSSCANPYATDLYCEDQEDRVLDTSFKVGSERGQGYVSAFSPIEFYITTPNSRNSTLIAFIRGERETLTVDDL